MAKKRTPRRSQTASANDTNWTLIGGLVGGGVLILLVLLILNVTQPGSVIEPTPVLSEAVAQIDEFCAENENACLIKGDDDAAVTLVEISDYGCPHCRDFNTQTAPLLQEQYVESGDVRWVVFPFALGQNTVPSAAATLCAAEQGSELAFDFHETLFGLQGTTVAHQPEGFTQVAERVGLDVDQFNSCVENETYVDRIHLNRQAAQQLRVNSTPSFFLNGRLIEGNLPLPNFQQQIDALLAENEADS